MGELEQLLDSVDAAQEEIIAFHRDIVRFPTVNTGVMPTGNETPCCQYVQGRLAAEGIDSEIVESAPTRGSLIARMRGRGGGPSLMMMGHLDVVPVGDESKWRFPPFSAELADGKIWGRGSDDCKAVVTAEYFATVLLKRSGLPLKGDLVFAAMADEESGAAYGCRWLAENAPEKIRTDYAINESGASPLPSREGLLYGLSLGEKGWLTATISISGRSGHAARPWLADSALDKAGRALAALASYQPAVDISHPIFDWVGEMAEGLERPNLETLEGTLARLAEVDLSASMLLRALSRMTITPTVLQAGTSPSIIPDSAVINCIVTTLPGQSVDYVKAEIMKALAGIDGVELRLEGWGDASQSPFGTPFTAILERALGLALRRPDVRLAPGHTIPYTDSRWPRALGVETYGFSPIPPWVPSGRPGVHGVNEHIEVDTLVARSRTYLATAYLTLVEGIEGWGAGPPK